MQQVLFSVDPTNHTINLSSANFDQLGTTGDPETGIGASGILITPNSIKVTSSGTIDIAAGKISLNAVSGINDAIANATSDKYTKVTDINITSDGISMNGAKYLKLTSGSSEVSITPIELKLGSGAIKIKNGQGNWERIWERSDIIYQATFPSTHPTELCRG